MIVTLVLSENFCILKILRQTNIAHKISMTILPKENFSSRTNGSQKRPTYLLMILVN